MTQLTASCLCGSVSFAVNGPLTNVLHCHCKMCQKAHAAAFRTRASVRQADLVWISGAALVTYFQSSPGVHRGFCSHCGSSIMTRKDGNNDTVGVPLGIFDHDPGARPVMHVFAESSATWAAICDDLPQYQSLPGAG